MGLPASQQRALDAIERSLQKREPRLASMFAIFTRLTGNEGIPPTETLEPAPWWSSRRRGARHVPVRHRAGDPSRIPSPGRAWAGGPPGPPIARPAGRPSSGLLRAWLLLPLAVILVVSAVFLSTGASRLGCASRMVFRGPVAQQVHARSCLAGRQARPGPQAKLGQPQARIAPGP